MFLLLTLSFAFWLIVIAPRFIPCHNSVQEIILCELSYPLIVCKIVWHPLYTQFPVMNFLQNDGTTEPKLTFNSLLMSLIVCHLFAWMILLISFTKSPMMKRWLWPGLQFFNDSHLSWKCLCQSCTGVSDRSPYILFICDALEELQHLLLLRNE